MKIFLDDLQEAYSLVPEVYFNDEVQQTHRKNFSSVQGIERSFMSELYHQWRKIMESKLDRYTNLILQTTIGKIIEPEKNTVEFPDMVLHGGQTGDHRNANEVFIEIKIENYDPQDVKKIFEALEYLNYNFGVYIINESTYDEIQKSVKNNTVNFKGKERFYRRFYFLNRIDGLFPATELLGVKNL